MRWPVLLAGAAGIAAVVAIHRKYSKRTDAIGYEQRAGVPVVHGQILQASPAEDGLLKVAMLMKGTLRTVVIMELEEPTLEIHHLKAALGHIQAQHGLLRVKVRSTDAFVEYDSALELEVDDTMEIPLRTHSVDASSLSEACESVWHGFEKVCAHRLLFARALFHGACHGLLMMFFTLSFISHLC